MRLIKIIGWIVLIVLVGACATVKKSKQTSELEKLQYAYSAAIRWGDFEGAWVLVDPKFQDEHPLTDLDLERYKQVQISGYRERGATTAADGDKVRLIEIGVINRHTMAERTVTYQERWHWDDEKETWLLTSGLPNLWGE